MFMLGLFFIRRTTYEFRWRSIATQFWEARNVMNNMSTAILAGDGLRIAAGGCRCFTLLSC